MVWPTTKYCLMSCAALGEPSSLLLIALAPSVQNKVFEVMPDFVERRSLLERRLDRTAASTTDRNVFVEDDEEIKLNSDSESHCVASTMVLPKFLLRLFVFDDFVLLCAQTLTRAMFRPVMTRRMVGTLRPPSSLVYAVFSADVGLLRKNLLRNILLLQSTSTTAARSRQRLRRQALACSTCSVWTRRLLL